MRFLTTALLFLSLPALSAVTPSFKNDREGESYFLGRKEIRAGKEVLKSLSRTQIMNAWREVLKETDNKKLCSFNVIDALSNKLNNKNIPGILTVLRNTDEIDDVVVEILTDAYDVVKHPAMLPPDHEYDNTKMYLPDDLAEKLDVVKKFKISKCFDEDYPALEEKLDLTDKELRALYVWAYKSKNINLDTYKALEKGRDLKVGTTGITLKAYHLKLSSLRSQYPIPDPKERSEFITDKISRKLKDGPRLRLMRTYTDIQIILMADVVKKLRERLEAPKVEILVYDKTALKETIELGPMERFRFAVKILRKEMANLALNSYFNGSAPSYIDVIAAAYELGVIPAVELEEVAGLEDIWNPKKTIWEKVSVWVRTFSSVATITLPPPYGFIPTLGLIIIEATWGKKKSNDNEASLF